jgi:hypothetical protein
MSVRLKDLNTVEWHTLNRLARSVAHVKFDTEALARLLELGLAERKPGGFVISAAGQDLIAPLKARTDRR